MEAKSKKFTQTRLIQNAAILDGNDQVAIIGITSIVVIASQKQGTNCSVFLGFSWVDVEIAEHIAHHVGNIVNSDTNKSRELEFEKRCFGSRLNMGSQLENIPHVRAVVIEGAQKVVHAIEFDQFSLVLLRESCSLEFITEAWANERSIFQVNDNFFGFFFIIGSCSFGLSFLSRFGFRFTLSFTLFFWFLFGSLIWGVLTTGITRTFRGCSILRNP